MGFPTQETLAQKQYRERKEREQAEKARLHAELQSKTYKRMLSMGVNPETGADLKTSPYFGTMGVGIC